MGETEEKPAWADEWEWRLDRSRPGFRQWPAGPWDDEPDKVVWREAGIPYPMMVVRNVPGALCGYVGVPPDHPLFGKAYGEAEDAGIQAHGGLTFSEGCHPGGHICHRPLPGESEVWWFGFDCSHFGDVSPGMLATLVNAVLDDSSGAYAYRDLEYVRGECRSLALQLLDMAEPKGAA